MPARLASKDVKPLRPVRLATAYPSGTTLFGYVIGIAVLIIVGIGLFFVFQRYGRR